MALAIATNNAALNAAASASSVNRDMETSMARLSTGKRINSASDDAAGVAISSRLSAEIRGTDQAIRNSLDGQALIDTAEGAHKEIENILQRMREVAVQAANDTNNTQDRGNLAAEMSAMVSEIDRISDTTTWAGAGLMEKESTTFSFQVGAATGKPNQIEISIESMGAVALGVGASTTDEISDRAKEIEAYKLLETDVSNAGTKLSEANTAKTTADDALSAANTAVDGDISTLVATLDAATGADVASALSALANMAGSASERTATQVLDDAEDAVAAFPEGEEAGAAHTTAAELVDDLSAAINSLSAQAGDNTTELAAVAQAVTDLTADALFSGVAGTKSEADAATATSDAAKLIIKTVADAGEDVEKAETDKATADDALGEDPGKALSPDGLKVDSGGSSRDSIIAIDAAILKVNNQRSALGSVSNRLNHTVNNLTNISSNLSAAKGGIEDADFALETTNLAKNQILQQASTAMLAQANASKQNVLSLLQG